MRKVLKRFMCLMLAVICAVSVVATVNPIKVSAKNKYKKGDYITFGSYEQDGNIENGAEPIEWEVLDVKDGKMLVISRYILDVKPYNDEFEYVTWETCTLRKWLNKDFYNSAFNDGEKKKIVKTKISNPDNKYYGTEGGKATKDNVFLLGVSEIRKYYKFNTWKKEYMYGYSQALMTEVTQYAIDNGLYWRTMTKSYYKNMLKYYGYKKKCIGRTSGYWWLRSPGGIGYYACFVFDHGYGGWCCYSNVYNGSVGVRPALYIEY